jgi:hypothetical protein
MAARPVNHPMTITAIHPSPFFYPPSHLSNNLTIIQFFTSSLSLPSPQFHVFVTGKLMDEDPSRIDVGLQRIADQYLLANFRDFSQIDYGVPYEHVSSKCMNSELTFEVVRV